MRQKNKPKLFKNWWIVSSQIIDGRVGGEQIQVWWLHLASTLGSLLVQVHTKESNEMLSTI